MELLIDHFPVFAVNQVLTSGHLNDVFDYLDQQSRQTRSHLIGIGIVCGLDINLDTSGSAAILLSKGCGVTSEGYLVVEPDDISLVAYRNYVLPTDLEYPPFTNPATSKPYAMWELFPTGEPNTTPLNNPPNFLAGKAVLLFHELKKQGLRNCSPNNCDDKGSEVTATVRRLLIGSADLDAIIAAANAFGTGLTSSDIDAALTARLNLPDLRLGRFNVVSSNPVTSNDVYAAFLQIFRAAGLAHAMGNALTSAYTAFKPLLAGAYPANPFANFIANFGFLDGLPVNTAQVRFLQYYVDLFDDLTRAYDEFRWKGLDLMCVCCPPDDIFPRHLTLGLTHPEAATQPGRYRQGFLPSPAVGDCMNETNDVLQLFARLVVLTASFSNAPGLPPADDKAARDPQIRITPSALGDRPLATKAIPYYYAENGASPPYKLWSFEKTRRNRANQNLSYRSDEYDPAAPAFVSDPLRYDLEPYNFLRVEGHLGKDYQRVLSTMLSLKSDYRLPIDVIALRTGAYDDKQPVDLSRESARFQDLEALYGALREDLMSSLAEGAMELYDAPVAGLQLAGGKPQLPLLQQYAPSYAYPANSVGAWYEQNLNRFETQPYIDVVDPSTIDANTVLTVYCQLFAGATAGMQSTNQPHVVAIYYISKLSEILPTTLDALAYADFAHKYQDLLGLVHFFRSDTINHVSSDLKAFIPQEELIDTCEDILFSCKLDSIKSVHDEYVRRIGDLRQKQFFSSFLALHPGIQHKAGAPLGGTFIVVYHGEPTVPGTKNIALNAFALSGLVVKPVVSAMQPAPALRAAAAAASDVGNSALIDAIGRIGSSKILSANADVSLLINSLIGKVPIFVSNQPLPGLDDASTKIIAATVDALADGTVIADFFLPYRVSCDCPGIQYVLPKPQPTFTTTAACTDANGNAAVTITAKGGVAPYDISVDQAGYQALSGPLQLTAGKHNLMLRDADGTETPAQAITIAAQLAIGAPTYICTDGNFTGSATITGGTPPYTANGKPVAANTFTTDPAASGTTVAVHVLDSNGCSATADFTHVCPPPCTLPCAGIALRRGYRFWIPDADPTNAYKSVALSGVVFSVESAPGKAIDLSGKIAPILTAQPADLTPAAFPGLVASWVARINKIIASEPALNEAGKAQWLTLGYEATNPGRLGVLWIEYFECLKFDIRITAEIVRSDETKFTLLYAPDQTTIVTGQAKTNVPAFGGTQTDKCSASPQPESLCPKPPAFSLAITTVSASGLTRSFKVDTTPPTDGLTFLWEAQGASPALGNSNAFTTTFAPFFGIAVITKLVMVTAFDKNGCTVTQSTQVPVTQAG
jgi:hypothetical protein